MAEQQTTRIWFDTEFIEDGRTIDLISIGMIRDDDHCLYMENQECDLSRADPWVRENVLPHLQGGAALARMDEIADAVRRFAGPRPEFWAYYADYDWVALCRLFGRMIDLPTGWPMFCLDIKQEAHRLGIERIGIPQEQEHHALADARWNRRAWEALHG